MCVCRSLVDKSCLIELHEIWNTVYMFSWIDLESFCFSDRFLARLLLDQHRLTITHRVNVKALPEIYKVDTTPS